MSEGSIVVVLGGSGYIGSAVVRYLLNKNFPVINVDLVLPGSVPEGLRAIRADILDSATLERIFWDFEVNAIVHLIGLPNIAYCERNPHLSYLLNVHSTHIVLEAARKADIDLLIFASSSAVYGYSSSLPVKEDAPTKPVTIYGYHKLMAEEEIKAYGRSYGIKYVILRLFNVYGGDYKIGKNIISIFIRNTLSGKPLKVLGPRKYRDFIHVKYVGKVIKRIIKNKNNSNIFYEVINVGTGKAIRLIEIANIFKELMQSVKVEVEITPDDNTGIFADVTKIRNILGIYIDDPLKDLRDYIKSSLQGG